MLNDAILSTPKELACGTRWRLETREVRSRRARNFGVGRRNSLKIGARGRTSAETFRVGAKGKIESGGDCFGPGQQTTRLDLDLTLNAEH
jgi:hypothetical protein